MVFLYWLLSRKSHTTFQNLIAPSGKERRFLKVKKTKVIKNVQRKEQMNNYTKEWGEEMLTC